MCNITITTVIVNIIATITVIMVFSTVKTGIWVFFNCQRQALMMMVSGPSSRAVAEAAAVPVLAVAAAAAAVAAAAGAVAGAAATRVDKLQGTTMVQGGLHGQPAKQK